VNTLLKRFVTYASQSTSVVEQFAFSMHNGGSKAPPVPQSSGMSVPTLSHAQSERNLPRHD